MKCGLFVIVILVKRLKNQWMDSTTKSAGIRKFRKLSHAVGYPDKVLEEQELDKFYKDLEFDENNFFGNMNNLTAFDRSSRLQKLKKPANTIDWTNMMPSTTVDAYYSPMANSIGPSIKFLFFFFQFFHCRRAMDVN